MLAHLGPQPGRLIHVHGLGHASHDHGLCGEAFHAGAGRLQRRTHSTLGGVRPCRPPRIENHLTNVLPHLALLALVGLRDQEQAACLSAPLRSRLCHNASATVVRKDNRSRAQDAPPQIACIDYCGARSPSVDNDFE